MQLTQATLKQIITSIALHMLTQLLALFTPIVPPKEGALELVGKDSKSCKVRAELKCARLAQWARDWGRFKDESEQ